MSINFLFDFLSASQMTVQRLYDYVNNLIENFSIKSTVDIDFSILCDKYPINKGFSNFLCKVLYVSLKTDKKTFRFYPDKLEECGLERVIINSSAHRKIREKMPEFFVNGNTHTEVYNEHPYYKYSVGPVPHSQKEILVKLREKYNVKEPELYIGMQQELVLEESFA